jgi:hypothetical protein
MTDALLIALVILFFVAAELFVRGCGRIIDRDLHDETEDRR